MALSVIAVVVLGFAAFAGAATNVVGTYSGKLQFATGSQYKSLVITINILNQQGEMFRGNLVSQDGTQLKVAGHVAGKTIQALAGKATDSHMVLIDGTINATNGNISIVGRYFQFDPDPNIAGMGVGFGILAKK